MSHIRLALFLFFVTCLGCTAGHFYHTEEAARKKEACISRWIDVVRDNEANAASACASIQRKKDQGQEVREDAPDVLRKLIDVATECDVDKYGAMSKRKMCETASEICMLFHTLEERPWL